MKIKLFCKMSTDNISCIKLEENKSGKVNRNNCRNMTTETDKTEHKQVKCTFHRCQWEKKVASCGKRKGVESLSKIGKIEGKVLSCILCLGNRKCLSSLFSLAAQMCNAQFA